MSARRCNCCVSCTRAANAEFISRVLQDRGSLRAEAEQLGIGEIHEYPLTSFYDLNFVKQLRRLTAFHQSESRSTSFIRIAFTPIFSA